MDDQASYTTSDNDNIKIKRYYQRDANESQAKERLETVEAHAFARVMYVRASAALTANASHNNIGRGQDLLLA